MLSAIQSIISNPTIYNLSQNTAAQVSIETCLKAVGRPSFILIDKNIDEKTKKYSATKEFLYQMTCLGIYLAVIIPVFKKGAFAAARKMFKDEAVFKAFKNPDEFMAFHKLDEAGKLAKLEELNKTITSGDKFTRENISEKSENIAKGAIEGTSIIGSVTGLALIAPVISHPLIHPILKAFGMEKKEGEVSNDKPEKGKYITAPQVAEDDKIEDNN